ncbi:VOC family protein [Streptomyces sp. NPDC048442]|uniref:VOC family protein n=1 Tax=Streptomyces sp. NPDC048442 TaxID=3154823 RepID=UPI00344A9B0F
MTEATTGAPSVYPALLYRDAKAAMVILTEAFGFKKDAVYEGEGDRIEHAELSYGNGSVMLGSKGRGGEFDKVMADAGPTSVYIVVTDTDAHHKHAVEYGAALGVEILMPPTDQDYGSRDYMAKDAEGNVWSFGTYVPGSHG